MTAKLYFNSDALEGTAVVVGVNDGERKTVRLDRTLFHPQGGGQQADHGSLVLDAADAVPIRVVDVRHGENGDIDHIVERLDGLLPGSRVSMRIDASRRRLNARLHSAGHLIAEVGERLAPGLKACAGHHWPNEARVEFDGHPGDVAAFESGLVQALHTAVEADVPITVAADTSTGRQVQVDAGVPVPCGGTHVASAAAIGTIQVRRVQPKGGRLRVSYDLADRDGSH